MTLIEFPFTPVAGEPLAEPRAATPVEALADSALTPVSSGGSRFAARVRRRYSAELHLLGPGLPDASSIETFYAQLRSAGHDVGAALRIMRQLVVERVLTEDCSGRASVTAVTGCMSELAGFSLGVADVCARRALEGLHGAPVGPDGQAAHIWVLGMGKLGARELNVSSDIDLIYIYDHDGQTRGLAGGSGKVSNQEFFAKYVKAMFTLIGDTTEHGFVFRVDLALRPNGNSGPPALSLGALEEYFQVQGREWERFAWLKSRVVAPQNALAKGPVLEIRRLVLPFVFRRYLDYRVFDSLRVLHRQIREHAAKRSAGRPERANDVKLSRGGIREIEFIVQLLQVVRGGQFPELRTRPTQSGLQRLARAALIPHSVADGLSRAYDFLRRVEHRIQYLDDQQSHVLPTDDDDLAWISKTMGFASTGEFLIQLNAHREFVAQEFDVLLGGNPSTCDGGACQPTPTDQPALETLLQNLPAQLGQRVQSWTNHPRVLALSDESRERLVKLLARTVLWLNAGRVSELAAVRLVDWVEPMLKRESYLALLLERPVVHERLLRMLGAARWPARYLLRHPGVVDELAGYQLFEERFNALDFERDLQRRRDALQNTEEDGEEALLNLLRRAHHAEIFRTLARDVDGKLTVEQVADDLSALAESVLRTSTQWCWERLKSRHRESPHIAIIAYGKLGGKELGYGSDLDIVFVYDDEAERAGEIYASLVRKLINWLTVKTGEGDLYEIDTALRPNGSAGLLVTSFDAFASYQQQRGSNTAWTWEHQAMTRARCVLGTEGLKRRFDEIRQAVIMAPRHAGQLQQEVSAMRARVRGAHAQKPGRFDLKQSPGGMIDVEFAVQYLVLSQAGAHPELTANVGNIALLERAQQCGLLAAPIGSDAANAYRALRQAQHRARLDEAATYVEDNSLATQQAAGLALWAAVFDS
jgi:[glutamine synthetase] adenylyltransferase / [glutamine synthetase]-adenylyl-L-tyrosine phosphorylase